MRVMLTPWFFLDANGQCTGDHDFIFYNQLKHTSGGVIHRGDDLSAEQSMKSLKYISR